jgi:hypothetical protein
MKPSSQVPLQLSSTPLQVSAGGTQLDMLPVHRVVPRLPHAVVQARPAVQHPSSAEPLQLSSIMLPQVSAAAGVTSPVQTLAHMRSGPQTCVPARQRPTDIEAAGPL